MELLRLAAGAAAAALAYSLIRSIKPEAAPFVLISGTVCVLIAAAGGAFEKLEGAFSLVSEFGIDSGNVMILVKCLVLCIITELAADICRENGAASLAGAVLIAGRAAALAETVPLLLPALRLAISLLE